LGLFLKPVDYLLFFLKFLHSMTALIPDNFFWHGDCFMIIEEKLKEVMLDIVGSCKGMGRWPWKDGRNLKLRKGGK